VSFPVASIAGQAALVFVIKLCFPHTVRAEVVLRAGSVAVVMGEMRSRVNAVFRRSLCLGQGH
jgi:hypothetical protein